MLNSMFTNQRENLNKVLNYICVCVSFLFTYIAASLKIVTFNFLHVSKDICAFLVVLISLEA